MIMLVAITNEITVVSAQSWFNDLRDRWLSELESSENKKDDYLKILRICSFFSRKPEALDIFKNNFSVESTCTVVTFETELLKELPQIDKNLEMKADSSSLEIEQSGSEESDNARNTLWYRDEGTNDVADFIPRYEDTEDELRKVQVAYQNSLEFLYKKRIALFTENSKEFLTYFNFLNTVGSSRKKDLILELAHFIYPKEFYQFIKLNPDVYFVKFKEKQDKILKQLFFIPYDERRILKRDAGNNFILSFLGQMLFRQRDSVAFLSDKYDEMFHYLFENFWELSVSDLFNFISMNEHSFFENFNTLTLEYQKSLTQSFLNKFTVISKNDVDKDFSELRKILALLTTFLKNSSLNKQLKLEIHQGKTECYQKVLSKWLEKLYVVADDGDICREASFALVKFMKDENVYRITASQVFPSKIVAFSDFVNFLLNENGQTFDIRFERTFHIFLVDHQNNKVSNEDLKLILQLVVFLEFNMLELINNYFNKINTLETGKRTAKNLILDKISHHATFHSILLCVAASMKLKLGESIDTQYPFLIELRNHNRANAPIRKLMEEIIIHCLDAKNSVLDKLIDCSSGGRVRSQSRKMVEEKQAGLQDAEKHEKIPNPFADVSNQPSWFAKAIGIKSASPEGSPTRDWWRKGSQNSGSPLCTAQKKSTARIDSAQVRTQVNK